MLQHIIGGHRRGCRIDIRSPSCVSYSSTGELAICDAGYRQVIIVSNEMLLLRKIKFPYVSFVPRDEIPSVYHDGPPAPLPLSTATSNYVHDEVDEAPSSPMRSPLGGRDSPTRSQLDVNSPSKSSANSALVGDGMDISTVDNSPVSVAFSVDGKLAIGYRRGGILVFHPYKSYNVGILDMLEVCSQLTPTN